MLRGIQRASANWLGRVVMAVMLGAIAVSFAIWGIGDIFRGGGRSTVAKIGRTEIGVDQFRQIYNDRLQLISRQIGRPLPPDQARALGFDKQILGQLLAEAALDERARAMGLNISDEEVGRRTMAENAFKGVSGQFDRTKFEQMIRAAGYTEQRYLTEQKRQTIRRQISTAITNAVPAPKTALEAFNRYENEQRNVEFVVLTEAQAGDVPKPTPEQLSKYFNDRKVLFRAPEFRKVIVLALTPDEIAKTLEISEADVKRAYEDRRDRFVTPERRHVQQMVFPNVEDAKRAAERIATGTGFEALATERGLKESDIDLGTVSKAGILDRTVADAAFASKEGTVSEPIAGRFGTVLVRVLKVEPEQVKPLDQVAEAIKRDIAVDRAKRDILDLQNKVEDERAAGLRLDEVAQKLKLNARIIEAVDRSGRGPNGEPVTGLPDDPGVLDKIFTSDVGVETDPAQVAGGGYAWVEVNGITPARERSLDEVKDRVETRWREEEIATRLKAKAAELADKLKSGKSLAEVAGEAKLKVETAQGVKRRGGGNLAPRLVEAMFRTPKDGVGTTEGNSAAEQIVFRVTDITLPKLDEAAAETKRLNETLRRGLQDELLSQYVARLETDLGLTIDERALRQATGAASPEN